jgi:L-rhamnose-proton symport protein (RhaT)
MLPYSPALGTGIIAVAGLISGMFTIPSITISSWKWEHIWLVYSISAYALLPAGLALALCPQVLSGLLGPGLDLSVKVGAYGLLFGIGSLLFGLSWVRLGLAIANALVTGVIVLAGSIGPILVGAVRMERQDWFHLAVGLAPLILSLVCCAAASVGRDHAQHKVTGSSVSLKQSVVGVLIAVASGLLSAMLNIGFAVGNPLIEAAGRAGAPGFLSTLAVWVPVLVGGFAANFCYTTFLINRSQSWQTLFAIDGTVILWGRCFMMGLLWFGAIFLYGYGASIIGNVGAVYGWALVNGAGVMGSNAVGAIAGEWRHCSWKPKLLMGISTALLVVSFVLLAVR